MKKRLVINMLILLLIAVFAVDLVAQCPMCRMAAESNLQNGGTEGKGLNTGILYILMLPYLLVATLGFVWWRKNKKAKEEEAFRDAMSDIRPSSESVA